MGAEASKAVQDEVDAVNEEGHTEAVAGIKLYKYVVAGTNGSWQLLSANAQPEFFDANEDSKKKKAEWILAIDAGEIEVKADNALKYDLSLKDKRITFHANGAIWAMRFPSEEITKIFVQELEDKTFYNTFGFDNDSQGRAKALGGDFAEVFFNCENTEIEPMEVEAEPETATPEDEEQEYEEKEVDKQGTPVHGIVMGATDNSYIMRGSQFDVLKNRVGYVEDAGISFNITPVKQGTPQFTPTKVLMTNGERNMNILTPDDRNKLFRANIEYQKVVGEFSFQKDGVDIPIDDIVHENKHAQLDDGNTFLGLAANRLCRWDLRDPTGVVQQSPVVEYTGGKDYARNTNFSCMATSGDGYVVVGSKDGKIRLYSNKSLNKANTSIPGLGAPITAVDVTFDGKWVVATTDDYLLVVKTIFVNKKGQETNGFKSPMGKDIPLPRLLRLKPEDIIRTGSKPFRNGKFQWITEGGKSERYIVGSVGKHTVIWNLAKVKTAVGESMSFGGLPTNMQYMITDKEEEVVDSTFMHDRFAAQQGGGTPLVVATPHKLFSLAS